MSEQDYIKEKDLHNGSEIISIEILEIIIEQTKQCICKINCSSGGTGTGFFCLIPSPDKLTNLPVLITNNHVLEEKDISKGKKINFTINNDKISKEITIDGSRKAFTNQNYDITIIEMKTSDNIDFKTFLQIDENVFKDDPIDFYRQKAIYLIYYPHGNKAAYSSGKIKNINLDSNKIEHICSTKPGSSGCPIINLNNNRVIGIHKGAEKNKNWNLGTFIKQPIEKFYEEYNNEIEKENNENKKLIDNPINNIENKKKSYDYTILREDCYEFDYSFRVIIIGNSGKKIYIFIYKYRCWKIMFINTSNKA